MYQHTDHPMHGVTLPPLRYVLFLPWRGTYVSAIRAGGRRVRLTGSRDGAATLFDDDARAAGTAVVRRLREPVELRRVDR